MDSDGSRLYIGCFVILILMLLKGYYSASEYAVMEIPDAKVKSYKDKDGSKKCLYNVASKPSKLITSFSVFKVLSVVLIAYTAFVVFNSRLTGIMSGIVKSDVLAQIFSVIIIILLTVILISILCVGVPKRIVCKKDSDAFAVMCAPSVRILVIILTPLTALCDLLTAGISRLFGISASDDKDVVTEEEILMMVDAGNETGVIEESQKEMINNVFEFDELTVSDVMTHRTGITGVEGSTDIHEVVRLSIESGFSRIPVYDNSIDHITGIICVKDLLTLIGSDTSVKTEAKSFQRTAIYVPETMLCGNLFELMTANKMQMAVVIDEYGGTAGIVTMEDVVESIVGNIQDEYDDEQENIVNVSDNVYTIDGTADPEEIFEQLGLELPEDSDYDTMSGFLIDLLGRIPEADEHPSAKYENVMFTVLVTEDMHISKIKAEVMPEEDENEKEKNNNEEKN